MLQEYSLGKYEVANRLDRTFRREVVKYIERCHLEDGGYFFARIPSSNGLDTYFAVKSLSILRVKPKHPETIVNFVLDQTKEDSLNGITGTFLTVEVLNELSQLTQEFQNYAARILTWQNEAGGFAATDDLYEVPSKLESTY